MNKASGGDGIPIELFQILKDDTVKELHSTCQQIWKTQQQPQDWKISIFIAIPKKGNAKECSSCGTVSHFSHASTVMLKIIQARLQQYVNHEIPDIQVVFRIGRGSVLVSSFTQLCLTATPRTAAGQTSLSITNSWSLLKLMSIELVMPINSLILCHLFLLPSIFPRIRVFSDD